MSGDPPSYGGWRPPSDRDWTPPPADDGPAPERPPAATWPGQAGQAQGGQWNPGPAGENNSRATAALVFGILGLIVCPLILSVVAIVLGYQARKEIDASGGRFRNRGAATAGIVLGWVGLVFGVLLALLFAFGLTADLDDLDRTEGVPSEPAVLLAPFGAGR